jgi:RNA polymerase sigma-70 factor (ECF subfamily)
MTEEALMARYCAGDARAFEQLYARLGPKLYGFFMRAFNDPAVAEDLLQTTLLKMHRSRGEFRPEASVRPWVFAIAARVRVDEHRRRRHITEPLDEDALARFDGGDKEGEDALDAGNGLRALREALAALPESQRVVIHLHRLEGMTFPQIARVLGSTEGAVKLRAFRGYARLRRALVSGRVRASEGTA